MKIKSRIDATNKRISDLKNKRNELLRTFRRKCKHTRLVELDEHPPRRICADCGAEERGWHCGYQVLVMKGDCGSDVPHKNERVLVQRTSSADVYCGYRQEGTLYLVGQSHPNFAGGGMKSYKQLTE